MDVTPDYLLIIPQRFADWEWDEETLCGVQVIKGHISVNSGHSGLDYPVTPAFKHLQEDRIFMQTTRFQQGFEDEAGTSF